MPPPSRIDRFTDLTFDLTMLLLMVVIPAFLCALSLFRLLHWIFHLFFRA